MKICFIHHNADLYGSSRSLWRLSRRLVRDGHSVVVVMPVEGPLYVALQDDGVECIVCRSIALIDRYQIRSWRGRFSFLFTCLISPFVLAAVIRRVRPDVVHTNVSVILTSGLAARLVGCPHIMHVRESYDDFRWLWKLYRRVILSGSDRVVCISRAVAQQFPESKKICVIYNGLPASEFEGISEDRVRAFRDVVNVDEGVWIGLPGRIKLKRKGQETFIEAAAIIKDKHPEVQFLIIGAPYPGNEAHEEELRRMVDEYNLNDRVCFVGEWQDMPAAYMALDVVVMPSGTPEPLGGVVIEGMAMRKPVIGSALGGPLEMIQDGDTGFLFPPGDAGALGKAMDRLCVSKELRMAMGEAGRQRFEERFEFESFYSCLLHLYEDVLKKSS